MAKLREYHEKRGDIERAEELYTVPTSAHLQSFILRLLLLAESIFVLTFAVPLTFRGIGALVQSLQSPIHDTCPQASALSPATHAGLLNTLEAAFASKPFQSKAIESLGGAVRIP